jgi:hypothetical protein
MTGSAVDVARAFGGRMLDRIGAKRPVLLGCLGLQRGVQQATAAGTAAEPTSATGVRRFPE